MRRKLNTELGEFGAHQNHVVLNHTLKDKPSLFTPTSFNLGDMSDLQKWLVAYCGASQYPAQGPETQGVGRCYDSGLHLSPADQQRQV